jgi:hypothetical protein
MTYLTKWLRGFACALLSALAVVAGFTLVAAALPVPGNALASDRDDDDDDDDRDGRGRHHGSRDFKIEVLSGRPDMIAGGDALIRVTVKKKHVRVRDVRIELNRADVTDSFIPNRAARTLTGLVTGMRLGRNELEVDAKGKGKGRADADITLVSHPIQGPIFSGPHEQPYACATHQFNLPAGLGPLTPEPIADPCHVPTRVDYIYRTNATPSALAA